MVAIIVANAIVASRLTNGRASDVKYKFNPGKSIERSARFHLSRSCHSLPGFSLLFSLVCASFRSRRSFARKYARRKTRSKSLSFARRLQKIISNYLVIVDSKKNVIVVGSLLFTIYTSVSIDNYNKTVIISRVFRSVARCKRFSLSRNIVERSTRKAYLYSRQKGKTWK